MVQKSASQSWYRVAGLRPRLAAQARTYRHVYRGEVWYVLQDLTTQTFFRIGPSAYRFLGLLDGELTVQEIWDSLSARMGDDAPTQEEIVRLLSQLHSSNVLLADLPADTAAMFQRQRKSSRAWVKNFLLNPMFAQIPLFDPDRFLTRWVEWVRPAFTYAGLAVFAAVFLGALGTALANWSALTERVTDRMLAPDNLFYLWACFAVVKTLHEFAHAFACKSRGGEVHEMGVMLLVLTPLPYMNASASWAFPSKRDRILVSSAGVLSDLFIASIAMFVWANVGPGLARTLAFNVITLGSISTIIFNGNPLLRYDGYYVLADLLELPNLRNGSNRQMSYLFEYYVFGRQEAEPAARSHGESAWYISYFFASFAYRAVVSVGIILFIAGKFFAIGVVLAIVAFITWGVVPIARGIRYLFTDPRLHRVRTRAIAVSAALLLVAAIVVGLAPMPYGVRAEGIVENPERAVLRARSPGFVREVRVRSGQPVKKGEILMVCDNRVIEKELEKVSLDVKQTRLKYERAFPQDRVESEIQRDQLKALEGRQAELRQQVAWLVTESPMDGIFVLPQEEYFPTRFIPQGEPLGEVIDFSHLVVRSVVPQSDVNVIHERLRRVEVRLSDHVAPKVPVSVEKEVPAGSDVLPSAALGSLGGGQALVDPRDPSGVRSLEHHFIFDLRLPGDVPKRIGARANVRFNLGTAPLALQGARFVRQLLLDRFGL